MSRKNVNIYPLALSQSLGASFTTAPTLIKYMDNCAYQINATTSDAIGTFAVEASLDYATNEVTNLVTNAGNWIALTLAGGTPSLASANDNIMINLNELPFNAIRLVYTRTSGTGTMSVYIMTKQMGG
jgi:hypothetical protein